MEIGFPVVMVVFLAEIRGADQWLVCQTEICKHRFHLGT